MFGTRSGLARTAAVIAAATVALVGCGSSEESDAADAPTSAASDGAWPRTVDTEQGPVEIPAAPERIVSTSVTLTGGLLAIDAPVIASGATSPDTEVADSQGFFTQWGDIAAERGIEPISSVDIDVERIVTQNPDLIFVSKTGADSAIDLYDQLSAVAPTIVVDYGNKTWQDVATVLGEATGHESDAADVIAQFDETVTSAKDAIDLPPQPTTALVYNGAESSNVWTDESAQGKLLVDLGFTLADLPDAVLGDNSMGTRKDIVSVSPENYSRAFTGTTVVLVNADESDVAAYLADPQLAQTPAVTERHVYDAGLDSFRLDYYSATNFVERLQEQLTA
ncbi:Fe2+-enterobactin ABC transporter substrate-binding protein [Rhodococcoides kyotonense]|uniref:Iron complex transport system substrate-binding protein n=1 Tax=Rhodococcoides kyotonense TaxID=398843 RepID=A0A239GSL0_9NOCA|nr:Fe2+-enterobactin ABC transporter substrate-binding protein [Rhodococcus kyotonensis]SNS71493.1 iron complex transport system substrate-binding protein [Rhodococcus kyotonensis]